MSGTAKRLAEAANQIMNPQPVAEAFKAGDKVKVPHKGKMVSGKIVRYDDGGTSKARQSGGGYVVDVGEPASILVPKHKVQKESVERIDELSKATKDAYVAKRGSQLSSMLSGHKRGKQLTGKQQANAVKGIKQATGKKEEVEVDETWKSLKKTKADLDAIRKSGKRVTLRHGEGDTLYRVSNPKKVKKEEVEASETELTLSEFLSQLSEQEIATIHNMMNETLNEGVKKKLAAALLAAGIGLGGSSAAASVPPVATKSVPTSVVKATKATPGKASPEAWKAMQKNKETKRKLGIGALGLGAAITGLGAAAGAAAIGLGGIQGGARRTRRR